eukprot:1187939-Prorocentrum_minimum.AAC.3
MDAVVCLVLMGVPMYGLPTPGLDCVVLLGDAAGPRMDQSVDAAVLRPNLGHSAHRPPGGSLNLLQL